VQRPTAKLLETSNIYSVLNSSQCRTPFMSACPTFNSVFPTPPPSQHSNMAMVRRSDNEYHLRVVSYCGHPGSRRFERKVDDFLEDLYNLEDLNLRAPGHLNIKPPLAFSECRLSEHDGRQAVLVKSSIRVASQIF